MHTQFVNCEKAFDPVPRKGLWRMLKAYCISDKLIRIVKIMCDDFECSVLALDKDV